MITMIRVMSWALFVVAIMVCLVACGMLLTS
jgi:hypothetical protein